MKRLLLLWMLGSIGCAGHRSLIRSGATPNEPIERQLPGGGSMSSYGAEKFDPIEKDPRYRVAFEKATLKTEQRLAKSPRGLGFVHLYWQTKKEILRRDFGIDWKTPSELNPYILYD